MEVSIAGIIVNIILLIIIVILIIVGLRIRADLQECQTVQSPYCPTVQCPCDAGAAPCGGYAIRPGPSPGTFYCSDAPNTLVDSTGAPV